MNEDPKQLSAVIGHAVLALRNEAGVPADAVARAANLVGLRWQRSTVTSLELGQRGVSAEELLLLPIVLTNALKRPVSLHELFREDVALTPGAHATPKGIRQILQGEEATVGRRGAWYFPKLREADLGSFEEALRRGALMIRPDVALAHAIDAAEDLLAGRAGEAEQKAARKLHRSAHQVATAARVRWGHSLTEERDSRVGAKLDPSASQRTVQAVRGRVTRELLADLAEDLATYPTPDRSDDGER